MAIKKTRSKKSPPRLAQKAAKKAVAQRQAKAPAGNAAGAPGPADNGTTQTKTAFVLSFPAEMPAKKVVARGKEAGVALTERAVYKTRYLSKVRAQKSGRKVAVKAMATATPPAAVAKSRRGAGDGRASALIRATPLEVKASEVVATARARGIRLTAGLVYAVRGQMKRSVRPAGAPVAARNAVVATRHEGAKVGERERQLISLAVDLGLSRAIDLIEGVRAKVKAMI